MSISNENRREFPLSQLPRTTSKYVIAYQGANVRQYWTNTRSWSRSPELAKSFYNPGDAYNRYCQLMQQTTLVPSFLGGLRKPSHFGIANLNDDGYWEPMVPLQEPTEKVTPQTSKEEPAQPKLPAVAEAISSDKITLAGLQQVVSYLVLALTHRDALSRAVQKQTRNA